MKVALGTLIQQAASAALPCGVSIVALLGRIGDQDKPLSTAMLCVSAANDEQYQAHVCRASAQGNGGLSNACVRTE